MYQSVEELQIDADARVEGYDAERTHWGKYCFGKTPMQTFIDSKKLADEKQVDRTAPRAINDQLAA